MINMDLCSTGSDTELELVTLSLSVFSSQKILRFSKTHLVPVRQKSPCCHPPPTAPFFLEGKIPCIAHGDEQKVSINFY